jgi:hypothetical protein
MRTNRRLTLTKETLSALTPDELRLVAGAELDGVTQPVKYCVTDLLTCYNTCMSWDTEQC